MSKTTTIMLVKNRALGDSIMGLSAVQYLKLVYPKGNIIYAVPQWIAPLYSESKTAADSIYPLAMANFRDFTKLFNDLRKFKVEHVHEMHQTGRGAKILRGLCFLLGIRYTAHNHHLKTWTGVVDQGKILPLIQRDLDGVFSFLGKGDKPRFDLYRPQLVPNIKKEKNRLIILGVVATRETKMWPLLNYIHLAKLIETKYPHYKIIVPLSKSQLDQKIKAELLKLGLPQNFSTVEWSLESLSSNFTQADFYIGNDTGLKHLAVAVGVKTYTFFGPEPVNEWHPYKQDEHPYFYLENLDCRTRKYHYCGLNICDLGEGNMQCLKSFTPDMVFNLIEHELLP
jgi:heptosyltransferase-2